MEKYFPKTKKSSVESVSIGSSNLPNPSPNPNVVVVEQVVRDNVVLDVVEEDVVRDVVEEDVVRDVVSDDVLQDVIEDDVRRGKRARMENTFEWEIISDPALRRPIMEYDPLIRDDVLRAYVLKGPCQPLLHVFPRTMFGQKSRCFQKGWFQDRDWLEYSVSADAAYCLWCYLFKGECRRNCGDGVFVKTGFRNWRRGTDKLKDHVGAAGSQHNDAKTLFLGYKDQRQSVTRSISTATQAQAADYRIRLTASLDCARYLLAQGLAFRGNDESLLSENKGNFKELLGWYGLRKPEVGNVVLTNAPANHQLTSPQVQKEFASACASETLKVLLSELGDKFFSLLVDESRDVSVKEQMAIVVRYVNNKGGVVERFLGVVHVVRLLLLWSSVVRVLENIVDDAPDSRTQGIAASLGEKMVSYQFVFVAHLMKIVLGYTNALSQLLQQKDQNIIAAMSLLQTTKKKFQELRDNGWDALLQQVNTFCDKNEVVILKMEDNVSSRFRSREAGYAVKMTNLHHFRVNIFYQVIDHIAQEMNARFSEANTQLLTCIGALDPNNSFANYSESKLVQLAELYPEDFSEHDRNNLVVELEMWISNMRENVAYSTIQDIGDLAKKMVEGGFHKAFHLVYRLIELVLVLPVATASVERAFSAMSLVKSDLRNRMGDEYLSDALVCKIEKDVFKRVDNEVILQHFQNMKTRKMLLPPLPLK